MNIATDVLESSVKPSAEAPVDLERIRKCARIMREQTRRLERRIEVVLRTLSTEVVRDAATFDVGEVVEAAAIEVAAKGSARQVTVERQLPSERLLGKGHASLLRQAIVEVLANGIEAAPNGDRVLLKLESEGNSAVITVEDSGPGIPTEVLQTIFDAEFSTKGTGRGFGLRWAMSVVAAHGGTIEADSKPGREPGCD